MTFGLDWPHFLAQVASFCIVCFILYRFAYRPVLKMLEVRRQQIAQGLANAEQIKAELARTEAQRREVMAQANVQANKLIEEARAAAPVSRSRRHKRPSLPPNKSCSRRGKRLLRTTPACLPNSSARSEGWLCRRRLRLSARF